MPTRTIIASTILLGLSSLLSRLLGVYRDHLLGFYFGTGSKGIYDIAIYHTAFKIPDFLYSVFIYGAISSAFIPLFTELTIKKDKEEAFRFTANIFNLMIIILLIVTGLIFIFAPYFVKIFAIGFEGERLSMMIDITRIMLLSPILFGISTIFQSIQNSFKTFLYVSLAPIIYNLSIIFGIIFFGHDYGIYGLSIAVVLGAFLHMAIQIPKVFKLGFRYKFYLNLKDNYLKKFFKIILPRVFGICIDQVTIIANSSIATTLSYSAATILPYTINIQSLPLGLFGIAFAVASFSTFSELAVKKEIKELATLLRSSISNISFFVIPSVFGMMLLKVDLIDFIFGSGKFLISDVINTANALKYLLIALPFQALIPLLSRIFYSFNDTRTPLFTSIFSLIFNLVFVWIFAINGTMDVSGITLAMAIAFTINSLTLLFLSKIKLKLENFFPFRNLFKITFASLCMYSILISILSRIKYLMPLQNNSLSEFFYIIIISALGAAIYLILAFVLDIDEFLSLYNKLKLRVKFLLNHKSFK